MSKKKIAALGLLAVVVLSVAGLLSLSSGGVQTGGEAVAVIRLSGPIQESATPSLLSGGGISPGFVKDRLDQADQDPSVRAVVLRVESPGGTVAASQEIAALIRSFGKPVVVSMADTAASGGYYISAPADHVVAQPGTLTGSIGVIWASIDPDRLLDKLGIKIDAITAGKHKDMFLPGRLTPERRKLVQDIVDTMHEQFIGEVVRGRGLPESEVRRLATGEVFTGSQAVDNGLVDELGGLETAITAAETEAGIEDARVVELSGSLFDQFLGPGLRAASSVTRPPDAIDARLALLRELLGGFNVPRYEL